MLENMDFSLLLGFICDVTLAAAIALSVMISALMTDDVRDLKKSDVLG